VIYFVCGRRHPLNGAKPTKWQFFIKWALFFDAKCIFTAFCAKNSLFDTIYIIFLAKQGSSNGNFTHFKLIFQPIKTKKDSNLSFQSCFGCAI
jgi:hypothetical protein